MTAPVENRNPILMAMQMLLVECERAATAATAQERHCEQMLTDCRKAREMTYTQLNTMREMYEAAKLKEERLETSKTSNEEEDDYPR